VRRVIEGIQGVGNEESHSTLLSRQCLDRAGEGSGRHTGVEPEIETIWGMRERCCVL